MATDVRRLHSINPFTEQEIEAFDVARGEEIDAALNLARDAFIPWRSTPLEQRCELLRGLARVLREGAEQHARTITQEMGKPITESRTEVEKCAFACEYFAANAVTFLADERAPSDSNASFIAYEPLGTVLACMPWNFPYWQVIRCAAPAVAAGNCVVLKHASNVTRCGMRLAQAFRDAGFPDGVFGFLPIGNEAVAAVIADPRIAAVSLTGSTAAGRSVGAAAGQHLKKSVLELGGADAFVVLEDADIAEAAAVAARSRFQNAGQSCIAAKRFIVVHAVADAFIEQLAERAGALRVGDPGDDATQIGPLARDDLRESIERQMRESVARGARVRSGGSRPQRTGFFLEPTVIDGCDVGMPAFQEETFGPLAAVATVRDEAEALEVANHSQFGLGGNVWTGDIERGIRFARAMSTGGVFVNGMTHSDPRLPFGGVRESGYGRELHRVGMHEFTNVKTVWMPERARPGEQR